MRNPSILCAATSASIIVIVMLAGPAAVSLLYVRWCAQAGCAEGGRRSTRYAHRQHINRMDGPRRIMHYPPDLSLASSYIPACLCLFKCTAAFVLFIFSPVRGWIGLIGLLLTDRILWNRHPAQCHYHYYGPAPSAPTILDVNAVCVALVGGLMVMHARADGLKTLSHFAVVGVWALLSSLQILGATRLHRAYEVLFAAFAVSALSCMHQAQERTELLALRSFAFVVANTALPYLGVMMQQQDIDTYVNACRTLLILLGEPEVAVAWITAHVLCIGYQVRRIGPALAQGQPQTAAGAGGGGGGEGGGGTGRRTLAGAKLRESSSYHPHHHQNPCFHYPNYAASDRGKGLDGDDGDDGEKGGFGGRHQLPSSFASPSFGAYPHHQPTYRALHEGVAQPQQGDSSSSMMANAQSTLRLIAPSSLSAQLKTASASSCPPLSGDLHQHHAGGVAPPSSPEEEAALLREALANRKGHGGRDA